ncbi:type II secretion system F family protein [Yinghuangia seranimata]|uniref:type II secretion system F family protein n=1 Tax=Yinghuangia seranimata TaxID=408067 RepID=UPI00248CE25A|nr:type II secretion system F family protein [Yinghuangia seranimata]MDI2127146.1 type II secretion system F family protein [Yinghuangia seranimata]
MTAALGAPPVPEVVAGPWMAALLGLGCGAGLVLVASGLLPRRSGDSVEDLDCGEDRFEAWLEQLRARASMVSARRLVATAVCAAGVGVLTGWPVAALLAGLAGWALPGLLRPDRASRVRTERIEAVAVWAEMLRDTLAAAAGLQQAIRATAPIAPPALETEVRALATAVEHGERLPDALRAFADDVDDPLADLVVAALLLAAERQAGQLADLLGSLAHATREQVTVRLKAGAERARVRTSVRMVVVVTLVMAFGLLLLDRAYLAPYGSATGQLVLAMVGALFALAFWWLARLASDRLPARILRGTRHPLPDTAPTIRPGAGA